MLSHIKDFKIIENLKIIGATNFRPADKYQLQPTCNSHFIDHDAMSNIEEFISQLQLTCNSKNLSYNPFASRKPQLQPTC